MICESYLKFYGRVGSSKFSMYLVNYLLHDVMSEKGLCSVKMVLKFLQGLYFGCILHAYVSKHAVALNYYWPR